MKDIVKPAICSTCGRAHTDGWKPRHPFVPRSAPDPARPTIDSTVRCEGRTFRVVGYSRQSEDALIVEDDYTYEVQVLSVDDVEMK